MAKEQHRDSTVSYETVFTHRHCGCVRAVLSDDPSVKHLHGLFVDLELTKTVRYERPRSAVPHAVKSARCRHEIGPLEIASWAFVDPKDDLFAVDLLDADDVRLNGKALQRCKILPSEISEAVGVGLNVEGARDAIAKRLGIDILATDVMANLMLPRSRVADSWMVHQALAAPLCRQLLSDQEGKASSLSRRLATRICGLLVAHRGGDDAALLVEQQMMALLSFCFVSCALIALGVDRRKVAYWAHKLSVSSPHQRVMCISVVDAFRTELVYAGQLERALGPALAEFQFATTREKRFALIRRMTENFLAHLTNPGPDFHAY